MEEKKPLDSRSLTHTSKEPEAQVWAKIGTSSYDPPINKAQGIVTDKQLPTPATTKENGMPKEQATTQEKPAVAAEVQGEAETQAENGKSEDKPASSPPKRKTNTLGDGFDTTGSESKEKRSRSRSRSRERRRRSRSPEKRSDYSTSSMNQKDIRSRVFIGHLNTTECSKKDIEDVFGPYGKITGINLQHGYGFVQYDNEDSVKEAIKKCHNTTFMGSRIVVDRPVALRRLEESENRDQRERRELMEELAYLRRRDDYYRRQFDYDRRDTRRGGGGGGWDHYPLFQIPSKAHVN